MAWLVRKRVQFIGVVFAFNKTLWNLLVGYIRASSGFVFDYGINFLPPHYQQCLTYNSYYPLYFFPISELHLRIGFFVVGKLRMLVNPHVGIQGLKYSSAVQTVQRKVAER